MLPTAPATCCLDVKHAEFTQTHSVQHNSQNNMIKRSVVFDSRFWLTFLTHAASGWRIRMLG